MKASRLFVAAVGLIIVHAADSHAYLAGGPIEISHAIVINLTDGSTRSACENTLGAGGNQKARWRVKIGIPERGDKQKKSSREPMIETICEQDIGENTVKNAFAEGFTPLVQFTGSITALIQKQMESERVIDINADAQGSWQFDTDGASVALQVDEEFSRHVYFAEDAVYLIPLGINNDADLKQAGIQNVFFRITVKESQPAEKSIYGSIRVLSGIVGAKVLLDKGLAGEMTDKGELTLANVHAGVHEIGLSHPAAESVTTFVHVQAGRTVLVSFPIPGTALREFSLTPLGKNGQGFEEYRRGIDGAVVVRIPEGEFLMGNRKTENSPLEHKVWVDDFLIDKLGVSWGQYKKFAADTGTALPPQAPPYWGLNDDEPAAYVTWEESGAYCEWAGGRLPFEAEREKAARGWDDRLFPWGDEAPNPHLAVFRISWGYAGPGKVGAHPAGASPYGLQDVGGNMWEWCSDWYSQNYFETGPYRNPPGPENGLAHVVKGGSWDSRPTVLSASSRNWGHRGYRDGDFGFRCAMNSPN